MKIDPLIVYTPEYDVRYLGLEKLHPFDTHKYSKAWTALYNQFGDEMVRRTVSPARPVNSDELLLVHTERYLQTLRSSAYLAQALELQFLTFTPLGIIEEHFIHPMRLGVMGTIMAAQAAVSHGIVVNMAGGYHHASQEKGEGFCLYADIPIAIETLRETMTISPEAQVVIVDLDAHQGNGYERVYQISDDVYILDMYNRDIYPHDWMAQERIDCNVQIFSGCDETNYLSRLKEHLPHALAEANNPPLAFYIAGTDIYHRDLLGQLDVSAEGVLERDRFVFDTFVEAGIPLVVVLGGGYSWDSYQLIADSLSYVIKTWGDTASA